MATDNTETNIASATASTYTPRPRGHDVGDVTYTDPTAGDDDNAIQVNRAGDDAADNYDYDEMLTSDATAAVSAAANTPRRARRRSPARRRSGRR